MGEKRLTASEREALARLHICWEILTRAPEWLGPRAAMVPGAKRDLAMMAAKINRLLEGMIDTIPTEQLMTVRRHLKMTSYTIGVRRPGPLQRDDREYGLWLPFEVLNALMAGCHDHCSLCDLDRSRRLACPLKKALDTIPNDGQDRPGDCPYYTLM